jgi:hypothetical protein
MISDDDVAKCLAELTWDDAADQKVPAGTSSEVLEVEKKGDDEVSDGEKEESFEDVYSEVMRLKREAQAQESRSDGEGSKEPRENLVASSGGDFSLSSADFERWQESVKKVDTKVVDADIEKERDQAAQQQVVNEELDTRSS